MPDFCPTCGKKLPFKNVEVCPVCGARTEGEAPPALNLKKNYGGFWVRFAAHIIDSVIISVVIYALLFALIVCISLSFGGSLGTPTAIFTVIYLPWLLLAFIIIWLYFAFQESSPRQATIGKQLMGLVITDYEGEPVSFWKATGRWLAKFLSVIILCIGFLMIGFTGKKQGLHDYVARTYVVKRSEPNKIAFILAIGVFVLVVLVIIFAAVAAAFVLGMPGNIQTVGV